MRPITYLKHYTNELLLNHKEYVLNNFTRKLSDRELLDLALLELDAAHKDINRLIELDKSNSQKWKNIIESISPGKDSVLDGNQAQRSVIPTSKFAGTNVINFYIKEKKYDNAYIWAIAIFGRLNKSISFLKSFQYLQIKRGEISSTLETAYAIAGIDRGTDAKAIRKLEGRYLELTGWTPVLPGGQVPIKNPIKNRILHLVKESRPYLSNGFTSRSHKNFVAESEVGLEPIVITEPGFPRKEVGRAFPKEHMVDGIRHVRLDVGDIDYSSMPVNEYLKTFAQLAYKEIVRFRPSAIHVSSGRRGYETALVGLALQEKTGLPLVYEVRSFFEANWTGDVEWETSGEVFARRMFVEEMCMRQANRVLTIGTSMKDELVSRGIHEDKIGIIPNAVDLDSFTVQPRPKSLALEYGINEYPTFGYVSNMDHYRESQETLIEACKILKDRGSDVRCVLVGDGPRSAELKELAERLQVEDRVVFTGAVDHLQIPEYYALIDVFVVPRIAERAATYVTPLKPFEAMAMAKPVVVSDLPALTEIVSPPERGLTFPPGDQLKLADLLEKLLVEPAELKRLGEAGLKWVRGSRTWGANGQRYLKEYGHIIKVDAK